MYDAFGRRIGEYDYVKNHADEWYREYFPYDEYAGMYVGPPTDPDYGLYSIYDNPLGSMRFDASDGNNAKNLGLYNPQGNDWVTCTQLLGYSKYANFDSHCSCWDRPWYIGPDGRPYDFSTGRYMGPQPLPSQDLLNPDLLNSYAYADNNPVNLIDSGTGDPSQPTLPGQDQAGTRNNTMPSCSVSDLGCQAKDLHDLALGFHELEEPLINKLIGGGMMVAGAGTAGTAVWLTVATGGAALPVTMQVMAGGTAMFIEGAYYEWTGQFWLPQ